MSTDKSKRTQVIEMLKLMKRRWVSQKLANQYGVGRLASRKYDIEKLGYEVETRYIPHNGSRYAEYRIAKEKK